MSPTAQRPMLASAAGDRPSLTSPSMPDTPQVRPMTMQHRTSADAKIKPDDQLFTKATHRKLDERPPTSPFTTAGKSVVKHK